VTITPDTGFFAQNTGVGTAVSVTFGKTPTARQFIGVWLTYDIISAIASDPAGYSKVPPRTQTQGSCYFYYKLSDGTETSFAVTLPSSVGWEVSTELFNGMPNPVLTDGDNGANAAGATTTPTSGSLTPTTDGGLVVAMIHHNGTGSVISSNGAGGWTVFATQGQIGTTGFHAYVIQTAAATVTFQPTASSFNYSGKIAAFKAAIAVPRRIMQIQRPMHLPQLAI
jgi:hypothetical protein